MALNVAKPTSTKATNSSAARSGGSPAASSALVSALFSGVQGERLAGTDFVTLAPPPARCVGLVYGRDKHGKSTFVTDYCPEPVFLLNLDNRAEEAAYRAVSQKERKVYYLACAPPADILSLENEEAKAYGREVLERLVRNFNSALDIIRSGGGVGTIAIDTVTELADLAKLAVRGRVDRPAGTKEDRGDFGKSDAIINRQLWFFSNAARGARVNLILLSRATEVYEGREASGKYAPKCDKVFTAACDWAVEIRKASVEDQVARFVAQNEGRPLSTAQILKVQKAGPTFELEVSSGGQIVEEEGQVYTEADWGGDDGAGPFAYAASKLIPRTTVEDWR